MFDKLIDLLVSAWNRINPIVFIMQCDQGTVQRGGKYIKTLYPGTYLRFPGIDIIATTNVKNGALCIREVNVTTADNVTITIAAKFNFVIENVYLATIETNDWKGNIVDTARGIMSDKLVKYNWSDIRDGKATEEVGRLITARAKEMGVTAFDFQFTDKLTIYGLKVFNA